MIEKLTATRNDYGPSINREYRPIIALGLHICLGSLLYVIFHQMGYLSELPSNMNLLNWDGDWYDRIRDYGYYYIEGRQSTLAFFPLFAFLWKVTLLNPIGMSLLNYLIFSIGFYRLAVVLDLDLKMSLLFLSTPSLIFCMVPYSEALFFLGSTFILLGFYKKVFLNILIGVIICSFTRSVNIIFIPALVFTYFGTYGLKREIIKPLIILISVILMSALAVFYIQYLYTGEWLLFFKVQRQWNRSFQIPTIPFTTITGTKMMWLDGIALFICVFAFCDSIKVLLKIFITGKPMAYSEVELFSMAYLSLIGFVSLFFSGVWNGQAGTSLLSLNRFVFSTPYFIVYTYKWMRTAGTKDWKDFFKLGFVLLIVAFCLGAYKSLFADKSYFVTVCYFLTMMLYIVLYFNVKVNYKVVILLYAINIITQLILYNRFLAYEWVG